jgi:SAM-dependent methyltransferase
MLNRLNPGENISELYVGCGCGGLGLILSERFGISNYTGIEINADAAKAAREMNARARIFNADFLTFSAVDLREGGYDLVVSLSCIDWNVGFDIALPKAFNYLRPGGHLLANFRLTNRETIDDLERSYQYINFDGDQSGERASYVVLNGGELIERFQRLNPEIISGFGYWGKPSVTAVTPFQTLCFAVLVVRKRATADESTAISLDLQLLAGVLPVEIGKR